MQFVNFNGKVVPLAQPLVGADNRGLRYGDGLFETIRLRNGQLLHADDHFARLWKGLQVLQFDLPRLFTPELLTSQILQLAAKNGHPNQARVRIEIIRGDGGLYDAVQHTPQYILQTWALPDAAGEFNSNGLVVEVYHEVKKSCDILANLKHNNYLPYVMAALFAKQQKCNDAIVLNQYERLCDTPIANLFLLKNGTLFTPPLSEGCVAGVMRSAIIQMVQQNGEKVVQQPLTLTDLMEADEVFTCSSIHPVKWVQRIGDRQYGFTTAQSIYTRLCATF